MIGYYFVKNETTHFSGEIGPSYVVEKLNVDHPNKLPPDDVLVPHLCSAAFLQQARKVFA